MSEKEDIFTKDSDYALFVGKKFNYYSTQWYKLLNKYEGSIAKFKKGGIKSISFNLSAFLFTSLWFLYRKMYFKGILFIVAFGFPGFMNIPGMFQFIISLFIMTACGISGNWHYFVHTHKKIEKLKKEIQNSDILKSEIINTGGTSKLAVLLGLLFYFVVLIGVSVHNESTNNNSGFSIEKLLSTEAPNCDDENVLETVKQLMNETLAKEESASVYIEDLGGVAEDYYNPKLKIRKCTLDIKLNNYVAGLSNYEGDATIGFVVNEKMVKLGDTI